MASSGATRRYIPEDCRRKEPRIRSRHACVSILRNTSHWSLLRAQRVSPFLLSLLIRPSLSSCSPPQGRSSSPLPLVRCEPIQCSSPISLRGQNFRKPSMPPRPPLPNTYVSNSILLPFGRGPIFHSKSSSNSHSAIRNSNTRLSIIVFLIRVILSDVLNILRRSRSFKSRSNFRCHFPSIFPPETPLATCYTAEMARRISRFRAADNFCRDPTLSWVRFLAHRRRRTTKRLQSSCRSSTTSVAFGFASKSVSILSEFPLKAPAAATVPSGPPFDSFGEATDDTWQAVVLFPQDLSPSRIQSDTGLSQTVG
jgi:hypothetical protein